MNEIWKDIKGYEKHYQVSSFGRVKNLKNKTVKTNILKGSKNQKGYLQVILCMKQKRKVFSIHRLVAQAFIPNPNNLPQVNHKNENKTDNNIQNLEWCTANYNNNYGQRNKKIKENHNSIIYNSVKKPVIQYDKSMNKIKEFESITEASKITKINLSTISCVCSKKRKTAGGYVWRFKK